MRYVTMDETWIHHYTSKSNRQSTEWTAKGETRARRLKTQMSAGKVLAFVFWDAHGILLIDYLEKGRTINSVWSITINIGAFEERNCEKTTPNEKEKVLFHQKNAPCHKSMKKIVKWNELSLELLPDPPYSSDMAPTDY